MITCTQEARDQWITEHRRRGEEVDLPPERCRHDQGIDQVVWMVDAEEHRAVGRDPLGVPEVDGFEEEPEGETNDEPHGGIESVHPIGWSRGIAPK